MLGRKRECGILNHLLDSARGGTSGSLVIRGEPGVGKTTLLEHAVGTAAGMRVARVAGVSSELGLPFAGLHQLLGGLLGGAEALPAPQRGALASAFGLADGLSPNRLHAGLGVLALLASAAAERPLLCALDDAHLLDDASAQILGFVARRLGPERIALVFTVDEASPRKLSLEGATELLLEGLSDDAALELLGTVVAGQTSVLVGRELIAGTRANPLALIELSADLTAAQLAGKAPLPTPLPLAEGLQKRLLRRIERLPGETQQMILLLAAEPAADQELLLRAARRLRLTSVALEPAVADGIVRHVGRQLVFGHSLVRSAAYAAASAKERGRAHRALAAAIDPAIDPARRAWHRAAAEGQPSERIAGELERAAEQPGVAVGSIAASALLVRAAELTPSEGRRGDRYLAAARHELLTGEPERVSALLEQARPHLTDPVQRALAERLAGELEFALGQNGDSVDKLLASARALAAVDSPQARVAYLVALEAAIYAGHVGDGEAVHAMQLAPPPKGDGTAPDLLLDGFAMLFTDGPAAAGPTLRRAVTLLADSDDPRWLGLGCQAAASVWDDGALHVLATREVDLARRAGAATGLVAALNRLAAVEVLEGRLGTAEKCLMEASEAASASGQAGIFGDRSPMHVLVEVWRGNEADARRLAERCLRAATTRGQNGIALFVQYALAVLDVSLGRYEHALAAARHVSEWEFAYVINSVFPEVVEGAAQSRQPKAAASALLQLGEAAQAGGTAWGLGMVARSRGLLAPRRSAEELYREAIEHLERTRVRPQVARAKLVYGEWLRRNRRRRDAREQLRDAHDMLRSMGMNGFAERARLELAATGEHVQVARAESLRHLTPQETLVARLVSEGASNAEVAGRLVISPRTVEYHLHKIYRKLGIGSRTQLTRYMLESDEATGRGSPREE